MMGIYESCRQVVWQMLQFEDPDTRASLRASKELMCTKQIEDLSIGLSSALKLKKKQIDRGNNTHFFLSTERMLPVPSWPISQEM